MSNGWSVGFYENCPCEYCLKSNQVGFLKLVDEKKQFSYGKAAAGAVLFGLPGIAAGAIGTKKFLYQCNKCGAYFIKEK